MKNCTNCGTALPDEARFCFQCGARQAGTAIHAAPGAAASMGEALDAAAAMGAAMARDGGASVPPAYQNAPVQAPVLTPPPPVTGNPPHGTVPASPPVTGNPPHGTVPAFPPVTGNPPHGTVPAASAAPSIAPPAAPAPSAAPSKAQTAAASKAQTAAPSKVRSVPVYDRGVLSRGQPGGKRVLVNILLASALVALQVFLIIFFSGFSDEGTDMLTTQIVGFIPVVVLLVYIFSLDTIEKEPIGLLVKLFILEGAFGMTVVLIAEVWLDSVFADLFAEYVFTPAYSFFEAVFLVGLVEELGKYVVLKRLTWKHPAFNYRFDGIVYAAVTALGFAAFENMAYVADSGLSVALIRAVSAVPGHCVDGILMGIFYGQAKCFEARGDRGKARRYRVLSIAAPVAEHGFYDFAANAGGDLSTVLFMGYVFLLNAVVFVAVWRLSQRDEAVAGTV